MKNAAKILLLICAVVGTAHAESFTLITLPQSALEAATPPAKEPFTPQDVPSFAAARTLDDHGYIGTIHISDVSTINLNAAISEIAVPEPISLLLFGSGLTVAFLRRRCLLSA